MSELLKQLRKHIEENSISVLQKQWENAEKSGFRGPNAYEYLAFLKDHMWCELESPPTSKNLIMNIKAPFFSGSFFYLKLHYGRRTKGRVQLR